MMADGEGERALSILTEARSYSVSERLLGLTSGKDESCSVASLNKKEGIVFMAEGD